MSLVNLVNKIRGSSDRKILFPEVRRANEMENREQHKELIEKR